MSPLVADATLESRVQEIGHALFRQADASPAPGLFSRQGAYAKMMEWAMRDPAFKTQLFRFVDVLPVLTSSREIVRHLQEYLGDQAVVLHPALKAGLGAASIAPALVAKPVKAQVLGLARQFVAGESPADLFERLRDNARRGIATTIDLLGEAVLNEREADIFLQRNLEMLDVVSAALARSRLEPCFSDFTPAGPLPRVNLSVKISALSPDLQPHDPARSVTALLRRLRPILQRAQALGAFINFDMESYQLKDLTLTLFRTVLEDPEFAEKPAVGLAIQAYLRDAERDLRSLLNWARARARRITIRLVKGAYWDYETVLAQQRDWPIPVWSHKAETDLCYERLSVLLLENTDLVTPAFASHNVRSCAHAIAQAERLGLDPRTFEFQALYGMADELKAALVASGYRVREYCPVGQLLPGMAYLVRRLLENTSNEGFIRARATGEASREELLQPPVPPTPTNAAATAARKANKDFRNAANSDFTREEARRAMIAALDLRKARAPERHPPIINGQPAAVSEWLPSLNPAHPSQIVGYWGKAGLAQADAAVAVARAAFPQWRATSVDARAALLERVADLMERQRFELAALEVLEAGKPWVEADADVSEAIDFCRFYAVEMRHLPQPSLTQRVAGESNVQTWTPRGTGVVIAPWNFPLAILCGLSVAPLVAGNTLILKPAEQTTVIAARFMSLLQEAGVPAGVVNFLPGFGEEIGAHLVSHPQIDFVAFTGSREVGLRIWETAGRTLPGQANLKKVVCEMGGKNALIIDNDADLDEAIPAALYSAFGFSGQKCSALSRLIVLDGIYATFLERFLPACASLPVGDPTEPSTLVGPVIDAEAQSRILQRIEQGRGEARLAFQGQVPADGFYVPPTVFTDVRPEHALAREEIFGPVLAILRARDLDEAFTWFNEGTDYALTGGLFSRSPIALARAREELHVGNLYLNRSITGAIVGRQPFGGYKMSGAGTKAGGRGYLENFLFPRVITENVLRRGFTPPEAGE